jgi:hypothetical protein
VSTLLKLDEKCDRVARPGVNVTILKIFSAKIGDFLLKECTDFYHNTTENANFVLKIWRKKSNNYPNRDP